MEASLLLFLSTAIGIAALYIWGKRVSPAPASSGDIEEQLRAGRNEPTPAPFWWRWLWPAIFWKTYPYHWTIGVRTCLALLPVAMALFLWNWGLSFFQCLTGAALIALVPGIWERSFRYKSLVDAPNHLLVLLTATAILQDRPILALILALIGGAMRETTPIFSALLSLSPLPLLGLFAVGWWRKRGEAFRNFEYYNEPFKTYSLKRWRDGFHPFMYLLPFGGLIVALGSGLWNVWASLAVAVLPIFRSVDNHRLIAYASPALVLGAVTAVEPRWLPALVFLSLFSKWES